MRRPGVRAAILKIARLMCRDFAGGPYTDPYIADSILPLLDNAATLSTRHLVAQLVDKLTTLKQLWKWGDEEQREKQRKERARKESYDELERRVAALRARPQPSSTAAPDTAPHVMPPPEPAGPQTAVTAEKAPVPAVTEDDEAAALKKKLEEREAALQAIVAEKMRQWEEAYRRRPASEALQKLTRRPR